MKPEIKSKWIAALRSGEYKQAEGMLRASEDTMCCLGVLCEIYRQDNNGPDWQQECYLGRSSYPANEVLEWAELDSSHPNPAVNFDGKKTYLGNLNDGSGVPKQDFGSIANIIEEQL